MSAADTLRKCAVCQDTGSKQGDGYLNCSECGAAVERTKFENEIARWCNSHEFHPGRANIEWEAYQRGKAAAEAERVMRDGDKQEPVAWISPRLMESLFSSRENAKIPSNWSVAVQAGQRAAEDVALYTHPAPSLPAVRVVPEGYALVPLDVTDDMIVAFAEEWYSKRQVIDDPDMADAYKAMLAVSPQPAAAPSGDVERAAPVSAAPSSSKLYTGGQFIRYIIAPEGYTVCNIGNNTVRLEPITATKE